MDSSSSSTSDEEEIRLRPLIPADDELLYEISDVVERSSSSANLVDSTDSKNETVLPTLPRNAIHSDNCEQINNKSGKPKKKYIKDSKYPKKNYSSTPCFSACDEEIGQRPLTASGYGEAVFDQSDNKECFNYPDNRNFPALSTHPTLSGNVTHSNNNEQINDKFATTKMNYLGHFRNILLNDSSKSDSPLCPVASDDTVNTNEIETALYSDKSVPFPTTAAVATDSVASADVLLDSSAVNANTNIHTLKQNLDCPSFTEEVNESVMEDISGSLNCGILCTIDNPSNQEKTDDSHFGVIAGETEVGTNNSLISKKSHTKDAECQTIVTGVIISRSLFHDDTTKDRNLISNCNVITLEGDNSEPNLVVFQDNLLGANLKKYGDELSDTNTSLISKTLHMKDAEYQTIVTGDIISMSLFHSDTTKDRNLIPNYNVITLEVDNSEPNLAPFQDIENSISGNFLRANLNKYSDELCDTFNSDNINNTSKSAIEDIIDELRPSSSSFSSPGTAARILYKIWRLAMSSFSSFCCIPGAGPMSGETIMNLSVSSNYGYCVLVALGSAFVLVWKSFKVGRARKQYNVPYPTMYSADNTQFNCVQRAHQNTLENYPQFLMMLLLGGLDSPLLSAVGGMIWLAGRVAYAKGYYTGDPAKRMKGSFGYIGLLLLLGTTSKLGLRMIGVL